MNAGSSLQQQLTIAIAKPTKSIANQSHTFELLERFLGMCQKRSSYAWKISDTRDTEVVIAFEDDARIDEWKHSNKIVVLVQNESRPAPNFQFTIHNPIRVMHILDLLENLGEHLSQEKQHKNVSPNKNTNQASNENCSKHWELVRALKSVYEDEKNESAYVIEINGEANLWLTSKLEKCKAHPDYFKQFSSILAGQVQLKSKPNHPPTESAILIPGNELLWRSAIGSTQDADDHAPWLPRNATYKLKRWPDLGALRANANLVRIISILAKHYVSVKELTLKTSENTHEIIAILNALSACNMIEIKTTSVQTALKTQATQKNKPEGFSRMIKSLRKHLNI